MMLWTCLCVSVKKKKRILKVLVLVKIWSFFKKNTKKGEFSLLFFLTPPFFSAGNRQTAKKSDWSSQMTKMLTKKILVTLGQKLTKKIYNLEPPSRPLWGGGLKSTLSLKVFTCMEYTEYFKAQRFDLNCVKIGSF